MTYKDHTIAPMEKSWLVFLNDVFDQDYYLDLKFFLDHEYEVQVVYPPRKMIFQAFYYTPLDMVRVVILGQDPYHGEGQAHGLAFSVLDGFKAPPSLRNILKELSQDLGKDFSKSNSLEAWARQGVLLLNDTLTVRAKKPGSHQNKGWELFTDAVINKLSHERESLVFVLWGRHAQSKGRVIDREKHLVLESAHPSPFSARLGFFGSRPFSLINNYLEQKKQSKIDWMRDR
jgi:uracil-DNA glycosylase